MKKSLIAFAALGAFAGVAQAQSSVTLYGIIDVGLNYVSNAGGHRQYNMTSGVMQGSRWGLKGAEDLGGGLKAIFTLENGFDVTNGRFGQGGAEFGRQAYVGLSSAQFGTVTLGRQYDSLVDFVGPFMAADQWGGYPAAHAGDVDNMNNTNRTNNAIKFTSANYSGVSFGGMYSLGGVSGDFSRNQVYSGGVGYANGPLSLAAAYVNIRNPNLAWFGDNPGALAATGSNIVSPIYSGYASAHTQQIIGAAGAYTFGPATVGITYSNVQFKGLGDATSGPTLLANGTRVTGGTGKFNDAEINFKYQLTPALLLGAAYNYTKESGTGNAKYHEVSAGVDYFLSKRTDVYLMGDWQKALGTNSQGVAAVAAINNLTPSTGNQQAYVRIGMRHKF